MPMQWNEQADARLFSNVLKLHVVKLDYQALAKAMGETVTAKAISHRISKIKEKAQARRFDWELYSNPPTSCTPKKRGPKAKFTDDEDNILKKRIKAEETVVKVEENAFDSDHTNTTAESIGEYYWSNEWPPAMATENEGQQQLYTHYELEGRDMGGNTDVAHGDVDEGCGNANVGCADGVVCYSNFGVRTDSASTGVLCANTST